MEAKYYLNKLFLCAAESLFEDDIKKYLDLGADVNCTDDDMDDTALHLACRSDRPLHLARGSDTALHLACRADIVILLLDRKCNPNHQNIQGQTTLHCAAEYSKPEIVKVLIEYGCIPDQKDTLGKTALHYAAKTDSTYIVKILIDNGCNPDQKDELGKTALHYAAKAASTDIVKVLIENGCTPDQKDKLGKTALHYAAESGSTDIVKVLIENGCTPDQKDELERTALHMVTSSQFVEPDMIRLLIDAGCSIDDKDKEGRTALHVAVLYQYVSADVISLLLESGFNPDEKDKQGSTALHVAASDTFIHEDVIPLLINSGCNLNEKDKKGRTALHFAAGNLSGANSDVIRLLLKHGCNPEVKNKEGKTPLDLIEEEGLQHHRDKRKRARTILKEYQEYWQKGLPIEIKELDKKSAKVFASLLEEEGYDHYEARVMLAGEQGTGKTTIARYLVGKGPTKIRMSTDGIDLYNGLSFIDRETEEWMHGKQGFKLSEIAISRSLRQSNDNSSNMNAKYKLTDREKNYLDTAGHPKIKQKVVIPLSVRSESKSDESDKNVASSNESCVSATESFCIHPQKDPGLVDNLCLENKYSNSFHDIGKAAVSRETKTKTKATKEIYPVIARESDVEILPRERKVFDPQIDGRETIPSSFNDNIFPRNESSNSANENGEFFRSEIHSKPHVESKEIGKTIEVVKDRGIIGKLKKLFGIQKDVTEVKVSMTKERFLKESMKVGKKKLHQKKIAPVIIWDFGGQDVFYSTHQTFLTYRAIYLLVLDGSRNLDDPCPVEQYLPGKSGDKTARDYLRFWINTIVTYCKGSGPGFPKIMIVLTHKDKLEAVEVESRRQILFCEIEKMFSGSPLLSHLVIKEQLFVNAKNKSDPEMAKIKRVITEQATMQPTWGQNLPKCFIPLELEFDSLLSRNIPLITMEQMERINYLQPVRPLTEEELKVFLKFQHSVGRILYFDEANLDQHIILSPTHLIDAFKSIVTDRGFCDGDTKRLESWDLMSKKGIIEKKSIDKIWEKKKYIKFKDHKGYLLGVMTHLDILVEPKRYDESQTRISAEFYYVASMVRTNDTTGYLISPTFTQSNIAIAFSHSSSMIPPALSFRFISYCLSIFAVKKYGQKDDELLFHRSAVFNIDQSLDMCVNCDDDIIVVRLVHLRNRTLIMRDLASSIRECLAVALEKISQLYVKTSSTDFVASKSSFNLSLCCSSSDDPCLLPISTLQQDGSWICPKHGIEHTKDMMSSWAIQKDEIQCGKGCPVTDAEFLEQIPSDIHLRRLSMQYSINETKELAMHLGMDYQTWDDLHVTFGEEPERLKFEVLLKTVVDTHLTFNDIRKAVEFGKIRSIHSLCKVVRGNLIDFDQEPEKWDLVPTEEHLDRVAPLVGNNSLSFLVELGLEFRTWEEIKYRQSERDLVKLNRHILQEWKTNFCSFHNIRPSLRDIGKAFNNIGKNIRIIENVLADLL